MIKRHITSQEVALYKQQVLEESVLVRPEVAAEILACSESSVRRLVREGELHGYAKNRGGKGLRILARELQEYVGSIRIEKDWWRR